jgi:hypothetical protein
MQNMSVATAAQAEEAAGLRGDALRVP